MSTTPSPLISIDDLITQLQLLKAQIGGKTLVFAYDGTESIGPAVAHIRYAGTTPITDSQWPEQRERHVVIVNNN
jgi:hypothetical protein